MQNEKEIYQLLNKIKECNDIVTAMIDYSDSRGGYPIGTLCKLRDSIYESKMIIFDMVERSLQDEHAVIRT